MASLALLDDLSTLTVGALLAGQATKSGHIWANSGSPSNGFLGGALSVDSIPSLTNLAAGGATSGGAITNAAGSNTLLLQSGTAPTSSKTDGTEG